MVRIMSEVHLRNRLTSARAVAMKVPVTSLTGFTVEHEAPVLRTSSTGVPIFDDEGNFVGVASSDKDMVYCPHCGGNFPVDDLHEVRFCGWCGVELKTEGGENMELE